MDRTLPMARSDGSWRLAVIGVIVGALWPGQVWANGIDLGMLASYSAAVLVPLIAFNVFAEGAVLGPGLRLAQRETWRILLRANLTSLAAGIPIKFLGAWIDDLRPAVDLEEELAAWPAAAALGIALFFAATVLTEAWVIWRWVRMESWPVTRSRTWAVVTLANVVTYVVLAPMYYLATRPSHDIQTFTAGAAGAKAPPDEVWYCEEGTGFLCRTDTRGGQRTLVIPRDVRDFQWHAASGRVLYRGGDNGLYLFDPERATNILCWATGDAYSMDEVACSPLGRHVAWLTTETRELWVRRAGVGPEGPSGVAFPQDPQAVAWTDREDEFLLCFPKERSLVRLGDDGGIREVVPAGAVRPARVYGRFGVYVGGASLQRDTRGREPRVTYEWHRVEPWFIRAFWGLGSRVRMSAGGSSVTVADNPGLLHLGRRRFWNVCLLPEKREALFDDDRAIYLLDFDGRKVGRVAAGRDFVLPIPRFERTTALSP